MTMIVGTFGCLVLFFAFLLSILSLSIHATHLAKRNKKRLDIENHLDIPAIPGSREGKYSVPFVLQQNKQG